VGFDASKKETRYLQAYCSLCGKGQRPILGSSCKWWNNIQKHLGEIFCEDVNLIEME
jgi:hypothetical protein